MKLALVVQRYGREVLGGAETLARQIAERLARRHDIDVLTTTARDYVTWKNEYPPGEEKLRGVRIVRFAVQSERRLEEFNKFSDWIYANPHSREDELRWLEMQGPVVPGLIDYLQKEHQRYDLLVFFTYLYYPTVLGIQVDPSKSVLVPTAHDEPPLKLGIYKEVFEKPIGLIFNSEEEEILVVQRFSVIKKMRETIGMGMELLDQPDLGEVRRRLKLPGRYLLYAGRIDAGKGCDELVRYFRLFRDERPDAASLQLLLMGSLSMKLPPTRAIRYLGFLEEQDKLAVMSGALAVVIPSRYESLSISALEAFSVGAPVIVNAGSKVLVEHCRQSNAGLYYRDFDEFEEILDLLLSDKGLGRQLGRQGQRYIKTKFGWDRLLPRYEVMFRASARPTRPALRAAAGVDARTASSRAEPVVERSAPEGQVSPPSAPEGEESAATRDTPAAPPAMSSAEQGADSAEPEGAVPKPVPEAQLAGPGDEGDRVPSRDDATSALGDSTLPADEVVTGPAPSANGAEAAGAGHQDRSPFDFASASGRVGSTAPRSTPVDPASFERSPEQPVAERESVGGGESSTADRRWPGASTGGEPGGDEPALTNEERQRPSPGWQTAGRSTERGGQDSGLTAGQEAPGSEEVVEISQTEEEDPGPGERDES